MLVRRLATRRFQLEEDDDDQDDVPVAVTSGGTGVPSAKVTCPPRGQREGGRTQNSCVRPPWLRC